MATIRKSFNFRSGLQVDNDNFVVNETGNVGIGTSTPQEYLLNVYGDKALRVTGLTTTGRLYAGIGTVGILSATDANISGVVTVGQLKVGSSEVVDNLIGYARTTFITDNAGVGLHTTSKIGVNTTTSPGASDVEFEVHGNANITGVLTATTLSGTLPVGDLSGTLTNAQLPTNIDKPTGIITASSFVGALTGTASTAQGLTGNPNITVTSVGTTDVNASGIVTATTELNVGTGGTAVTALDSGRLGIGTAIPTSELQIRKASGSLLEVISDSGQARISIGNSVGVGNSSAILRFGNSSNNFDIINYDVGDIRNILGSSSNPSTGSFKWIDGDVNVERMTLTNDGKLGINETSPAQTLHVGGGATVDGALYVQNNLTVDGTITGTINYPSVISGTNLNNTSAITTLNNLDVNNEVDFQSANFVGMSTVGIGTTMPDSYETSPVGLTVKNTVSANKIVVDDAIDISSGIISATTVTANFNSGSSTDSAISIQVLTSPDRIVFTKVGTALTATINLS